MKSTARRFRKLLSVISCNSSYAVEENHFKINDSIHVMLRRNDKGKVPNISKVGEYIPRAPHPLIGKKEECEPTVSETKTIEEE
mmetsp:Transcript_30751/g.45517  ORF Transcript_30751/g.45517 Transcript_30751/m.45517 type:complete len:84 (-) Transcript_30751:485-736(-)